MKFSRLSQLFVASRSVSDKYLASVRCVHSRFVRAVGDIDVKRIDERHICSFFATLTPLKPATQSHQLRILKAMLHFADKIGEIRRIPEFPEVAIPIRLPSAWTEEEFRAIYTAAASESGRIGVQPARIWWQNLLAVVFYSGARIGSIMQLEWRDVDFARGTILLRAESTKAKRDQLHAMPQLVVSRLRQFTWPQRKLVFEHPFSRYWPFRALRRIARRVGLEPPPGERFSLFHKIRRTSASLAAQNGVHVAQLLLGHSCPGSP